MSQTLIRTHVDDSRPTGRAMPPAWRWLAVFGFLGIGLVSLSIDLPVARWFVDPPIPGDVRKLLTYSEIFGHGLGVFMIALTAAVLDPRHGRVAWFLLVHSLGAGLTADACKLVVGRCRPVHCDSLEINVLDTMMGWFPAIFHPDYTSWFDSRYASFPSAHAAAAAGLAVGLSILYPKGRWLFPCFALLAGLQRCFSHSHFVSDVFVGYAVGLAWTCLIWRFWPDGLATCEMVAKYRTTCGG
jgi:membrane-associated phospholipid phosphatase